MKNETYCIGLCGCEPDPVPPRRAPSGWWIIPALCGVLIGGALAAWVWL
ncbi:hypothetical protein [Thioclava kandeliae]|uniref:Uncharacterized protein n=1 Tax=Thioclava kandeliae TaxID=3070818 RepID=A0ABV1SG58_9RHOB